MTQFIEHYLCNGAPCVHVEPALPLAELDYLIGLSPPRYPVPMVNDVYWDEWGIYLCCVDENSMCNLVALVSRQQG